MWQTHFWLVCTKTVIFNGLARFKVERILIWLVFACVFFCFDAVNVNQYSLWQTFRASGIFTQEICLILIHYGFFNWIKYDYRALNVTQKGAEIISGCAYAFIVALFISELWFTGNSIDNCHYFDFN